MFDKEYNGKVLTISGPVDPEELGAVSMHEHLYVQFPNPNIGEQPAAPERIELLMNYAVPNLKKLKDYGSYAFLDVTASSFRAQPELYRQIADASGIHIILSTGIYREVPIGTYTIKNEDDAIWPFARRCTQEELEDFMRGEFLYGIKGSGVRPGAIKLGNSADVMTPTELKAFKAAARVQREAGVHITIHSGCRFCGDDIPKAQLDVLEKEGVDLRRVVIGHTQNNIREMPAETRECLKRGATFMPTNLRMDDDWDGIQKLVDEIRRLFDEGYGDRLTLGLDYTFDTELGFFIPCHFMPPPPYVYMYAYTLPRFRKLGLEEEAIHQMMVENPKRLLPIQM